MKKILAVIPARGGSKGIPKKNIYNLNNKPLIYYTIKAALDSELITHLVVSTDSEEIRNIAISNGAEAPFIRPDELSGDKALAIPTIQHSVLEMEKIKNLVYDYVIMLQPTTPLRQARDIDKALSLLVSEDADGIISVVDVDNWHPMKMKVVKDNLLFDYQMPPTENPPRQSLPKVYMVNGAIYAAKRDVLINNSTFKGNVCLPYIMPEERSVNIDKLTDFLVAEYYIKELQDE